MFIKALTGAVAAAAVLALTSPAFAVVINPGAPGEKSLQQILDDITVGPVPGKSSVNVNTDQINSPHWTSGASGGSVSTLVFEASALSGINSFGLYDSANHNNRLQVFNGASNPGQQVLLSFLANGDVLLNGSNIGNLSNGTFGFYLDNGTNVFYSDSALNGGVDRMVGFQGTGDTVQILPFAPGVWGANEFIFGWEDGTDFDFNDFVVLVESISPVPEPATLGLLGVGLLGLGLIRRRKTA